MPDAPEGIKVTTRTQQFLDDTWDSHLLPHSTSETQSQMENLDSSTKARKGALQSGQEDTELRTRDQGLVPACCVEYYRATKSITVSRPALPGVGPKKFMLNERSQRGRLHSV